MMGNGYPGFPPGGMPGRMPVPTDPEHAWAQYTAPDGRPYYYNSITHENTWEKPKALLEREKNGNIQKVAPAASIPNTNFPPGSVSQPIVAQPTAVQSSTTTPNTQENKDSGRPVCSLPVSGTPWCVVWTGDGKVFFFNPTTKMSLWQRPPELYNRPDVDLMVSKPPDQSKNGTTSGNGDMQEANSTINEKNVSDEENVDNNDVVEPPRKKTRQEKKQEKLEEQKRAEEKEKKEKSKPKPKEIDPDLIAEKQAQEKRAQIPLEDRKKEFRQMLEERGVSANSTFQKELSKIVFDPRYLLLSASERRECFEEYSRERAEIERAEKKAKAKEAKEKFFELLKECNLDSKSSYTSFVNKYGKDERFKAVEKNRDREDYFKDYVDELYKKEKEERKKHKEEAKVGFIELLKEQEGLHRRSKWSKIKKHIDNDSRYRAKYLDSEWREELFRNYVSTLPDKDETDDEKDKDKHKEDKLKTVEEIALENRKREVEAELGDFKKERNKEKDAMMIKEETENYRLLLKELFKHGDESWHDARKLLKKESRYKRLEYLTRDEKEAIYKEHVRELSKKRQEGLFQLFNEEPEFNPNSRWKEVRDYLMKNEKYSKYSENERKLENDFRDWRKKRLNELIDAFKELLNETKIITYESKQKILHNEGHLSDILSVLEKDKRYLDLSSCPEIRESELESYIEELDKRGPQQSVHTVEPESKP